MRFEGDSHQTRARRERYPLTLYEQHALFLTSAPCRRRRTPSDPRCLRVYQIT